VAQRDGNMAGQAPVRCRSVTGEKKSEEGGEWAGPVKIGEGSEPHMRMGDGLWKCLGLVE
jgi:hypothetical protein